MNRLQISLEAASELDLPAYKNGSDPQTGFVDRASRLRTFDTCHCPLRAVRTPRLFKAIARPRQLAMPAFCSAVIVGKTASAKSIGCLRLNITPRGCRMVRIRRTAEPGAL
ncbi:hypothetical protein [Mesorhizobium sophorae]|uniref:hypothetical protein n=1 Tax=Mesorhizobium sophorae TaxID=1300294 RepID=UPI0011805A7A|nr:hypothetical protein [Mesorhizobium sophorae]